MIIAVTYIIGDGVIAFLILLLSVFPVLFFRSINIDAFLI